ncbi:MAG: nucleotidyltransferase [Alphaproteobacteria bacterium]|nr:nucleotidyltransferase [Alphaproteobacteria bacterium]
MSIQSNFLTFHQTILLSDDDGRANLREKRERVLRRLRLGSPRSFDSFNQGSYAMSTGIVPVNGDYDIDVGVIYSGAQRPDPLTVKGWVYEAVKDHTSDVVWRRPCITVWYKSGGRRIYHVDLAVYWQDAWGRLSLAVGKQHSSGAHVAWLESDPKGFIEQVKGHLSGEDRAQFRRVIRYLKRWKDVHFPSEGNAAPVGIGITVAALQWFQPVKAGWRAEGASQYDDLAATQALVRSMRSAFGARLSVRLPVQPFTDVFERMTDQQMLEFRGRLEALDANLERARLGASSVLKTAFGEDFPA